MQRIALLTLLALVCLLRGCAPATPPERVEGKVRIAVLSPAAADLLADLGLSDHIVARHAFDRFLPQDLPVVGDQSGIDYERLLRAQPTHVLLEWGAREIPSRLNAFAQERDWSVEDFPLLTLADIRAGTLRLGELFGAQGQAQAIVNRMDAAWTKRPGVGEAAGRTLPLYWTNPIGVAGPGSFHAQLLEAMGVTLAVTAGNPYITLDPEDLRRLDPDTIVLFVPGADEAELAATLAPLADLRLRAVIGERVVLINDPKCLTPSGAMIRVADETSAAVLRLGPP